jgi:hypothetical protein
MFVLRNKDALSRNNCCSGQAISITYSECVCVVLRIQHAMRMRRITLSSVACPAVPYFSILSHKRHDFREKLLNIKRILISSIHFVWNISHCKKNSTRCYDTCLQVKYRLFLSDFNETWRNSTDFGNYWNIAFQENLSNELDDRIFWIEC